MRKKISLDLYPTIELAIKINWQIFAHKLATSYLKKTFYGVNRDYERVFSLLDCPASSSLFLVFIFLRFVCLLEYNFVIHALHAENHEEADADDDVHEYHLEVDP